MYTRVEKKRMSSTERNRPEQIQSFLHPDLLANDRVTVEKFERKNFKQGLLEDESPFPVIPKVGPYIVSLILFKA